MDSRRYERSDDLTPAWARLIGLCVAGFILAGALVRLAALLHARSLWADEAMLALNVTGHTPLEVLRPLDLLQVAPPAFLWLQQLSAALLGVTEVGMRLVPTLAGVLACVLAWPVARRITGRPAAVIVVGLLSLSATLVSYANEAKPYVMDAAASLAVLLLTLRALEQPGSRSRTGALVACLALGPFVSFPVAFLGAGAVLAFLVVARRERLGASALLVLVPWLAGSLGSLLLQQDPTTRAAMADYWQGMFLDFRDPGFAWNFWGDLAFTAVLGGARLTTADVIERMSGIVVLLLCGVGVVRLLRRDPELFVALSAPVFAAAVVSVSGYYPLSLRLWLWAVPLVTLLLVSGLTAIADRRTPALLLGIAVVLCFPAARRDLYFLSNPIDGPEDAKSVVPALLEKRTDQDALYVPARSAAAWLFYTFPWSRPDSAAEEWLDGYMELASPGGPAFINGPAPEALEPDAARVLASAPPEGALLGVSSGYVIAARNRPITGTAPRWAALDVDRIRALGRRCTWVFYSHVMGPERALLGDALAAAGAMPVDSVRARGASAVRYC